MDEVEEKANVHIIMTMTTPACPFGPELIQQVKETVCKLPGAGDVEVQLTLTPPWTPDRMTEDARDELGMFWKGRPICRGILSLALVERRDPGLANEPVLR